MKPIICFYENRKFLYSCDYRILNCKPEQNLMDFLNSVENEYFSVIKIIQINFEALHGDNFSHQTELYKSAKATVWVLQSYELLTAEEILSRISKSNSQVGGDLKFSPLISKDQFEYAVNKIKTDICAGRIYQANFTSVFKAQSNIESEIVFRNLFEKFNSPYSALLPAAEYDVMCFSPELFVEKTNDNLKTEPIKGSAAVDQDFSEELLANEKENAELSMIVDLLRNDLNRIAYLEGENTAAVVNLHRARMKLNYIQHTYSEISLQTNANLATTMNCMFPGGSISGCPKIESLNVISELETYKRQVYTGAIGWWHNNNFKLNLAIRTLIKHRDNIYYHSGCGIVFDSNPQKEWNEFLLKAGALMPDFDSADFVLDTFSVVNSEITYFQHHVERTFEACRSICASTDRLAVEDLYLKILAKLKTENTKNIIYSIHVNPYNLADFKLNSRARDTLPEVVSLQLVKRKDDTSKTIPTRKSEYKWVNREDWQRLLSVKKNEADDILLVNTDDSVAETSRFNLFFYDSQTDTVYTPPLSSGCINGVFRRSVLSKKRIDLPGGAKQVEERVIHVSELLRFKIYCGNSVRGLLPAQVLT